METKIGSRKFPSGLLRHDKISHDSDQFRYIQTLHAMLWVFVRHYYGQGAGGFLEDYLNKFLEEHEIGLESVE
jgi:hypothetical protein